MLHLLLNLIQRLGLFFCHVMRCWCLHGVALLESQVFHEHVDMSENRADTQFLALHLCNLLFNALKPSVDP